jgi:hypothetical protein
MPHDNPDLPEMIRTVREFVDGIGERLEGLDRYHALCASYLLEICLRELAEWQRLPSADDERLRAFLGAGPAVPPPALVTELARRIGAGDYDARLDELLELVLGHVEAKVRVSKPAVLTGAGA